jgi:adenylate cyclase
MERLTGTLKRTMTRAAVGLKDFFLPKHGKVSLAPSAAVAIVAVLLGMALGSLSVFQHLEWSLYNRYVEISTRRAAPAPGIVIVAIDEPSFQEMRLGWPWPRSLHAALVRSLHDAGARTIVFDIVFDSPSSAPEEDAEFAESLKAAGNVVLAADWQDTADQSYSLMQWVEPVEVIATAAQATGIARLPFDPDGRVRRSPLEFHGKPSLPLAVALLQPSFRAPADTGASRLIHFNGPSRLGIKTVSYYQALNFSEMLPKGIFQDKIVLVGLSLGSSPILTHSVDEFLTPYPDPMPGVEIHATTLDSLLRSRFIKEPFPTPLSVSLLGLAIALGVAPLFYRQGALFGLAINMAIVLAMVVSGFAVYSVFQVKIPVAVPAEMACAMFLLSYAYRFLLGIVERRMILGAFKHYLAPAIVDRILKDPGQLRLGGADFEVTIIFTDLEGFSTISEKLSAEKLHDLLTEYFKAMMDVLLEEHATLDKFIGDAIMVYFGCPVEESDHPLHACRAAVRMQRRVDELNTGWQARGLPPLHMRVGINTGHVVAGNMGTDSIFNYTIIGDSVNLASRLEGVNKEYGTSTIISEDTYRPIAASLTARELDCIRVKGKSEPVAIYELASLAGESSAGTQCLFSEYAQGLALYRNRSWAEAVELFCRILEREPNDVPSRTMRERSSYYLENPPPEDWDGVYTMLHK